MTPKKEKVPMDKEKKKKIRRRVIAGVLAALVVAFFVRNSMMAKNAAPMVTTVAVTTGDVEQILSTGGTVKSDEKRTYFAPLSVEVGEVMVSTGDTVKKGDVMLTFERLPQPLSCVPHLLNHRLSSMLPVLFSYRCGTVTYRASCSQQ